MKTLGILVENITMVLFHCPERDATRMRSKTINSDFYLRRHGSRGSFKTEKEVAQCTFTDIEHSSNNIPTYSIKSEVEGKPGDNLQ